MKLLLAAALGALAGYGVGALSGYAAGLFCTDLTCTTCRPETRL